MSDESDQDSTQNQKMLREMLSRMQDETRRRIEDLRQDQAQVSGELDSVRTTADTETRAGLIALAEEKLRHLDEAMVRLDAGKYGSCLKCAGAISFERLMAIPFASYCVDCQKKLNRKEGGWGHAPYDRQWTVSKEVRPSPRPESCFVAREEPSTIRESEPAGPVQLKGKILKYDLPKKRAGFDDRAGGPGVRSQ